ncbi:hypothetical protein SDC9_176832 [bioreactor metagenome]|uniref:Uncharacterized protein n=1 Tax=bioreactor metagenome TaxID=1076179 RepID=A0A645GUE1_9ZZZZ
MFSDSAKQFAVFGAKRPELRLDFIGYKACGVGNEFNVFKVEFFLDNGLIHAADLCALHIHSLERLAVLDRGSVSRGTAKHDDVHNLIHLLFKLRINELLARLREVG